MSVINYSLFSDFDINLFKAGKHFRIYDKLGSHILEVDGQQGTYFAVWAPNARKVSVIGNFNYWDKSAHELASRWDGSGIWEGFIPNVGKGEVYKYYVLAPDGRHLQKGDPYARRWETPPQTASVIWDTWYEWNDEKWMAKRKANAAQPKPYSVYELHLASWRRNVADDNRSLTYVEHASELVAYIKEMGFTHVEFMPVMEHPYSPSWGYQITGYFAPTSRFGTPQDFMFLVDTLHQADIGVILDWVPSHFPADAHGLYEFDGTHLYEHADPRLGYHPDWKSMIFNYGRNEVRSFLISNALFWIDRYHADGLRVDAVASMLYLDYSRKAGEWIPNMFGGNQNLESISLLREFNEAVKSEFPDVVTIAEESTAWSGVSRPTYDGGLGFDQKWMMGWMHDTLTYFKRDPMYRKWHQGEITFSLVYAFTENFMLPFSHDEVVHGKGTLLGRMPGDEWQRFANLRLMLAYMYSHPGTKLMFMGSELGQIAEWNHESSVHWHLSESHFHKGIQTLVKDLNAAYNKYPALYHYAFSGEGFEWVAFDDNDNCVIAYIRKGLNEHAPILVVCNMTPRTLHNYELGVPVAGTWVEILNSDAAIYGGSNVSNAGKLETLDKPTHRHNQALSLSLAPLATTMIVLDKAKAIKVIKSAKAVAAPVEKKEAAPAKAKAKAKK